VPDNVITFSQFNPENTSAVLGVKRDEEGLELGCPQLGSRGNTVDTYPDQIPSSNTVVYPVHLNSMVVAPFLPKFQAGEVVVDDKDDQRYVISNKETRRSTEPQGVRYALDRGADSYRKHPQFPRIHNPHHQNYSLHSVYPSYPQNKHKYSHNPARYSPGPFRTNRSMRGQEYYKNERHQVARNGPNFFPDSTHFHRPVSHLNYMNPALTDSEAGFSKSDRCRRSRLRPDERTYPDFRPFRRNHQSSQFHQGRSSQHPYPSERSRGSWHPMHHPNHRRYQANRPLQSGPDNRRPNFRHRSWAPSHNIYKASSSHRERSPESSPSRDRQWSAYRFDRKPPWRDYYDDKLRDANTRSVTTKMTPASLNVYPCSHLPEVHNNELSLNQPPIAILRSDSTKLEPVAAHLPPGHNRDKRVIGLEGDPHDTPSVSISESGSSDPHFQFAQDGESVSCVTCDPLK
jgi:hypothetical protein